MGLSQLAAAVVLLALGADGGRAVIHWLVDAELAEDPTEVLAGHLSALAQGIPASQVAFYTLYFAGHGALHVLVVAALLMRLWRAYPAGIVVLSGFVLLQAVEWWSGGGSLLLALTGIDLLVIYLTWREWRDRPAQ